MLAILTYSARFDTDIDKIRCESFGRPLTVGNLDTAIEQGHAIEINLGGGYWVTLPASEIAAVDHRLYESLLPIHAAVAAKNA